MSSSSSAFQNVIGGKLKLKKAGAVPKAIGKKKTKKKAVADVADVKTDDGRDAVAPAVPDIVVQTKTAAELKFEETRRRMVCASSCWCARVG